MLLRVRISRKGRNRHRCDDAQFVFNLIDVDARVFDRLGHTAAALLLQAVKVLRNLVVQLRGVLIEQLLEALGLKRDLARGVEAARIFVNRLQLDAVVHVLGRVEVVLLFLLFPARKEAALFLFLFSAAFRLLLALRLGVMLFDGLHRHRLGFQLQIRQFLRFGGNARFARRNRHGFRFGPVLCAHLGAALRLQNLLQ